jgi:hypothetical protein
MYVECYIREHNGEWDRKLVFTGYNRWIIDLDLTDWPSMYTYRIGDGYGVMHTYLTINNKRHLTYTHDNSDWVLEDSIHCDCMDMIKYIMKDYSGHVSTALKLQPPYGCSRWPGGCSGCHPQLNYSFLVLKCT